MAATIGYARVSSNAQSTDSQVERLKAAGCTVIRKESVSGRSREGRSELATILEFIQAGDTLTVVKLDRLGRSTRDVLNLVHEVEGRGSAPASARARDLHRWPHGQDGAHRAGHGGRDGTRFHPRAPAGDRKSTRLNSSHT